MKYDESILLLAEFEESLADTKEKEIKELQALQTMTSKDLMKEANSQRGTN